jgi:hypothetical protein
MSISVSVSFSGERPAPSDSVGPPTDNCDLTTTTTVPLVNVGLLQERLPRDDFTFMINHKHFQLQLMRLCCSRQPFVNNFNFTLVQEGLSFPAVQLFVKSCIRNCLFYSVSNNANDNPARLGTELIASAILLAWISFCAQSGLFSDRE